MPSNSTVMRPSVSVQLRPSGLPVSSSCPEPKGARQPMAPARRSPATLAGLPGRGGESSAMLRGTRAISEGPGRNTTAAMLSIFSPWGGGGPTRLHRSAPRIRSWGWRIWGAHADQDTARLHVCRPRRAFPTNAGTKTGLDELSNVSFSRTAEEGLSASSSRNSPGTVPGIVAERQTSRTMTHHCIRTQ